MCILLLLGGFSINIYLITLGDGIVKFYNLADTCLAVPSLSDILIFACLAGRKYYLIMVLSCIFLSSNKIEDEIKYFPSFLNGTLPNM